MILNLSLALALLGGTCASVQQVVHSSKPTAAQTQLQVNFTKPFLDFRRDGIPAEFADYYPKKWGEESASVKLPGRAEPLALNEAETLLAVGYAEHVLLYEMPSLKHIQTIQAFGRVLGIAFMQDERMMLLSSHKIPDSKQPGGRSQSVTRLLDLKYELSRPFTGINTKSAVPQSSSEWLTTEAQMKKHSLWFMKAGYWDRPTFIDGGSFFVAPPNSNSVRAVIDSSSLEEMFVLPPKGFVDISPDNRFLTSQPSLSDSISIWNASAGTLAHVLPASHRHTSELSIGGGFIAAAWDPTQLRIWNIQTGHSSRSISLRSSDPSHLSGYKLWKLSPDGKYLALADKILPSVQIFDLENGDVTAQGPILGLKQNHNGLFPRRWISRTLQFDRQGRVFICVGRITFVYDLKSNVKWQFEGPWSEQKSERSIVLTKDGFISADDDGVVRLWKF